MKLKRWLSLGCVGVLVCMLLTGCQRVTPLPEGIEKREIIAAGQEVLNLLLAEDYEAIEARVREDIRTQGDAPFTAGAVRTLVEDQMKKEEVGSFKKVSNTHTQDIVQDGTESHGIVVFHCKFTQETVGIAFSFDTNMELIGLTIARE